MVKQFFQEPHIDPPCVLSTIELSSHLSLNIELDPYTEFETNNCTKHEHLPFKLVLRYQFSKLNESLIITPPALKRKRIEYRDLVLLNALKYTYIKLDLDSFLAYCKYLDAAVA